VRGCPPELRTVFRKRGGDDFMIERILLALALAAGPQEPA
jgi:hypothetical protein